MEKPNLTQFSHGSGCGCKIAPADLEAILSQAGVSTLSFPNLLVGNGNNDDAAVMDLGNGQCVISTTDFFTPVVDDAFEFGQIASANAISDVYAMGGTPTMAVAILGWPIEQLGTTLAAEVVSGARSICEEAGIPLAGGHSIDSKEPFFGLAVTGLVDKINLKRNNTAQESDVLFLTKPLGVGILSTAMKRELAPEEHIQLAIDQMKQLNSIGSELARIEGVTAMTDVTGFGLIGHLIEMCEGAKLSANIKFDAVPTFSENVLKPYLDQFIMPDNTMRNFKAFSPKCSKLSAKQLQILCDPQTNGGLLIAVKKENENDVAMVLASKNLYSKQIGTMQSNTQPLLINVA